MSDVSEIKEVTKEEYIAAYTPGPGMLLIEKDMATEKTRGGLWIPRSMTEKGLKYAGTGIIRKKSPFPVFQEAHDEELFKLFKEGMHVGFNNTTPWVSPLPPYMGFKKEQNGQDIALVTIHMGDVIALFDFEGKNPPYKDSRPAPGSCIPVEF